MIGQQVTEVVVRHRHRPRGIDFDRGIERRPPCGRIHPDGRAPCLAAVGGRRERDLIVLATVEARILPDDVQMPRRWIDRGFGDDIACTHLLAGVGIRDPCSPQIGDDFRFRPCGAVVRRLDKCNLAGCDVEGWTNQIEEVVKRPILRVDHDLVADRLLPRRHLHDD